MRHPEFRERHFASLLELSSSTVMASVAGPSEARKAPSKRDKKQHAVRSSKVKKLSDKQQIELLEKAAMEFVRVQTVWLFGCGSLTQV